MFPDEFDDIMNEIKEERWKQVGKWGIQNHHPYHWLTIIMEELGEASEAALKQQKDEYRYELIQTVACCIAAVECIDRKPSTFYPIDVDDEKNCAAINGIRMMLMALIRRAPGNQREELENLAKMVENYIKANGYGEALDFFLPRHK